MKNKTKKSLLFSSIALCAVSLLASIGVVTYAGFQRDTIVKDPTTSQNLSITGEGTRLTTYYLDLDIWGTIDNTGYSFWILVFKYNSGNTPTVLKYVKGTLSGSNYSFSIDRVKYDRIKFFRTASSNDATLTSSSTYSHSYYTDSGGYATDATSELEFSSGNVTYQVTAWHGSPAFEKDANGKWR